MPQQKSITDTGWRPSTPVVEKGQLLGQIQQVTGLEQSPCCLCRSYEKNDKKLRQHIASKKNIEVLPDGTFRHIIDRDVPDRNTKTFNIRDFGYCRLYGMPTQQLHSCEKWTPTRSVADFRRKFGK